MLCARADAPSAIIATAKTNFFIVSVSIIKMLNFSKKAPYQTLLFISIKQRCNCTKFTAATTT